MRPLLISTFDERGGAARAALRLLKALSGIGIGARMLVQQRDSDLASVVGPEGSIGRGWSRARSVIDRVPVVAYRRRTRSIFSPAWLPSSAPRRIAEMEPDVVNLHWTAAGFVSIEEVARFGRPVVWTMHDMWLMTGGCHHSNGCMRFTQSCGSCPILGSRWPLDLSRTGMKRKGAAWRKIEDFHVVAPARWLAELAQTSPLLADRPIHVVPNGIDIGVFRPIPRHVARELLRLPPEGPVIGFGAAGPANRAKGTHLLDAALDHLAGDLQDVTVAVFGSSRPVFSGPGRSVTRLLGPVRDDVTLALVYSACDVTVVPSPIETFSNIVLESMACGTPVVAFDVGGFPDAIDHRSNGYLARPYDTDDLAAGIRFLIDDRGRLDAVSRSARSRVEADFDASLMARRYRAIYEQAAA